MSGGFWDYRDSSLAHDIFGWRCYIDYGLKDKEMLAVSRQNVRRDNPFEDKEISELVYDVFCLIHSYDWYHSGDTGEDDYREDVKYFKDKWFGKSVDDRVKSEIEKGIEEVRTSLLQEFLYETDIGNVYK